MTKFALSTLTVAVASTLFAVPSLAKDFVFNPGDHAVNKMEMLFTTN